MTIKTLVCVLAETRANELTWNSFKTNVLDTLDADLALCISTPDGYDYNNQMWTNAKYKWTCPEYTDFGDAFEYAKQTDWPEATCDWRKMLKLKDQWLGGILDANDQHPGSAAILEFFRWFLWKNIRENDILNQYDRIVITRSDFMWLSPHPPMDMLDPAKIWLPDGEYHGGVTDRHAVLSKYNAEIYLNIIKPILSDADNLFIKMQNSRENGAWNLERFIKMSIIDNLGPQAMRFFPYIMYAVRPEGGTTRWSTGNWNSELGYYVKYRAEYDSARQFAEYIKNKDSWRNLQILFK